MCFPARLQTTVCSLAMLLFILVLPSVLAASCVETAMPASRRGSSIHISLESLSQGARVVVTGQDKIEAPLEALSEESPVLALIEAVGGVLELMNQPGHPVRVTVDLPSVLRTRLAGGEDGTA